jgi:hypothetical protein
MFKEVKKHMHEHVENPAKKFKPTDEDKMPTLTQTYWANPNSQRGEIEICSYGAGIKETTRRSEGV